MKGAGQTWTQVVSLETLRSWGTWPDLEFCGIAARFLVKNVVKTLLVLSPGLQRLGREEMGFGDWGVGV